MTPLHTKSQNNLYEYICIHKPYVYGGVLLGCYWTAGLSLIYACACINWKACIHTKCNLYSHPSVRSFHWFSLHILILLSNHVQYHHQMHNEYTTRYKIIKCKNYTKELQNIKPLGADVVHHTGPFGLIVDQSFLESELFNCYFASCFTLSTKVIHWPLSKTKQYGSMHTFALSTKNINWKPTTNIVHDKSIHRNSPNVLLGWPKLYWDSKDSTEWLTNWWTDWLISLPINWCRYDSLQYVHNTLPDEALCRCSCSPTTAYLHYPHLFLTAQRYLTSNQWLLLLWLSQVT